MSVQLLVLDLALTRWCRSISSSKALDLLHWEMCAVLYQRIAMAIEMASKYGVFLHRVLHATLAATGAIRSEYLPDGDIQRLLV